MRSKPPPRRTSAARPTKPNRPGTPARPAPPPPAARLAPRGEIARGGMGVIQRVFDTRLERTVARKEIDATLAQHPEMVARFLDEARITAQLEHPNIVPIHDLTEDTPGARPAILMKLVGGETLAARIGSSPPRTQRDLTRLLEIFLKVCDAVAFAHSRGVIHRDLKPDNIMLGEFGQVYVMDWGCAHVIRRGKGKPAEGQPRRTLVEEPGSVIGTPGYMAPEQAWGKVDKLDERTDVFGLGGILYHMLTGTSPYTGATTTAAIRKARTSEPRPPQEVAGDIRLPPGLCRIAMRALAHDPRDRFETVDDLRGEIEGFLRGGSYFDSHTFAAGSLIVREGDTADVAYVITEGTAEAFRMERGRRVSLRLLGPGDVFGEGAIFAAGVRNASVVALDAVTAIVVSRESIHEELALDSWMGAFVRALAVRYRDLEARRRVTSIATDHLRAKTAIIDYISRAGTWTTAAGARTLEASWSRLWTAIGPELRLAEADVLDLVARSADLVHDRAADTITLAVPAD